MKQIITLALTIATITMTIVVAIIFIPKYRYAQGYTYKVVERHDIRTTESGGMALYLTVSDANGNNYEARTGFIAQWDIKEGRYISAKKITILHTMYNTNGYYYVDGTVITSDGNEWSYTQDDIRHNCSVTVTFDDNATPYCITDDIIVSVAEVEYNIELTPTVGSHDIEPSLEDELAHKSRVGEGETYIVTAYCGCVQCCGKNDCITATGTVATEGRTIAVDPTIIPYGTTVYIDGVPYVAEDCGGAIKGNHIDMYFESHSDALKWGVQECKVTIS